MSNKIIKELKRTQNFNQNNEDVRINPAVPLQDQEQIKKLWKVINSGKSYSEVLDYVSNEIEESVREIEFHYEIKCFLSDGAYALHQAIEDKFGFIKQRGEKNPSGNKPPKMIDVKFADGTHVKVPFGKIDLPLFGEEAYIDMFYDKDASTMYLKGSCQKRYVKDLDNIVDRTIWKVNNESIYKNKAVKFVLNEEPEFINLENIDSIPMFLTEEAKFATEPVMARIEKTEECIANNIDIRFGALLEGNYGTGKTLYAFKTALSAIRNGWSFIYCAEPQHSLEAMEMAHNLSRNGKGVVLFIEDIDRVLKERNDITNKISLMMDGGESKSNNIITILTTNHISKIDPTFMRGKRIGTIITLSHPDHETAMTMLHKMLVDNNGKTLLKEGEDISEAATKIVELKIVPAFISEIIDRVKSHLIFRDEKVVTCKDIINSINTFQKQMNLSEMKQEIKTPADRLAEALVEVVGYTDTSYIKSGLDYIESKVDDIYSSM